MNVQLLFINFISNNFKNNNYCHKQINALKPFHLFIFFVSWGWGQIQSTWYDGHSLATNPT
jgi:hypothetical protein